MEIEYYIVHAGCMGLVDGKYQLFRTTDEYFNHMARLLADSREN